MLSVSVLDCKVVICLDIMNDDSYVYVLHSTMTRLSISHKRVWSTKHNILRKYWHGVSIIHPNVLTYFLIFTFVRPGYNSKRFYPAKPGEVLANRYQILVKVGWGTSSTVWFARDMRGYCCFSMNL